MKPIVPKTNIRSNAKRNAKSNVVKPTVKPNTKQPSIKRDKAKLQLRKKRFNESGKLNLFGELTYKELKHTLYRLSNKLPNEKTMDLAKRILDVYNGKGTRLDVLNFKKLIREFEKESNIKINDLFSFLRNSKAPKTLEINNRELAKLDRHVLQYAEVLQWFDSMIEGIKLKDNKIIRGPTKINFKNRELTKRFLELLEKENVKANKWLEENKHLKDADGVINAEVMHGAVIFFVDARKPLPELIAIQNEKSFGFFLSEQHALPTIIAINVNPNIRTNITINETLKHELRHNLFNKFGRLKISDKHIPIYSATHNVAIPELQQKGLEFRKELILKDRKLYETLLERKLTREDLETNILRQRDYLDELHSYFVGKHDTLFKYDYNVYPMFGFKGLHHEVVGNNPKDINATKDMFCHLQGLYTLDKQANDFKDSRFKIRIPEFYAKAGAIIATSLTVQQASRLIAQLWGNLLREFPSVGKNINHLFSAIPKNEKGRPSNGQTIEQFLAREPIMQKEK